MTENNIKFSVIMPCYNSEQYVKKAIDSILNQTYGNWELIAVNDGSADSSFKLLEKASFQDERIRVIPTEHQNAGAARNIGLKAARGRYICFLDVDDGYDQALLRECVDVLDGTGAGSPTKSSGCLIRIMSAEATLSPDRFCFPKYTSKDLS